MLNSNKKIKGKSFVIISLLILLILISIVKITYAQAFSSYTGYDYNPNPRSYYSGDIGTYWTGFGKEECTARQDFLVEILPGGCSPPVIRSDLLEENNVPVFCQLTGIKINPLIEVPEITSITFKQGGTMPKDIVGLGFHPARAALKTWGSKLIGSPVLNNLGYLVVVVKNEPIEKNMTKWVQANLTAKITYKAEKAFGVGRASFVLPVLTDEEWRERYKEFGFWHGKGYIRVLEIERSNNKEYARIGIYSDATNQIASFRLDEGKTSDEIYLPGYYCQAGFRVNAYNLDSPQDKAKIIIDDDVLWAKKGQEITEGCSVSDITPNILGGGKVKISCQDKTYTLEKNPPNAKIKVTDKSGKDVISGEFKTKEPIVLAIDPSIKLAYVGNTRTASSNMLKGVDKNFAVVIKPKAKYDKEVDEAFINSFAVTVKGIMEGQGKIKLSGVWSSVTNFITQNVNDDKKKKGTSEIFKKTDSLTGKDGLQDRLRSAFSGKLYIIVLEEGGESQGGEKSESEDFGGLNFKLENIVGASDAKYTASDESELNNLIETYYKQAEQAYKVVARDYGSEKEKAETGYEKGEKQGAKALFNAAKLAGDIKKFKTQKELLEKIIQDYPDSDSAKEAESMLKGNLLEETSGTSAVVRIEGETHFVSLQDIEPSSKGKEVTVRINGKEQEGKVEGDFVDTGKISISEIKEEEVKFSYNYNAGREPVQREVTIEKGKDKTILTGESKEDAFNIYVGEITFNKEADLRIEPIVQRAETDANFTFKIGIEKRALKLSPEKTKDIINELNATITQWEGLVNNLGNLVKAWKATCLATSTALWVGNFFSNMGGGSIARQKVLRGTDGWYEKCAEMKSAGTYATIHQCLNDKNDVIENEIQTVKEHLTDDVNKEIQDSQQYTKSEIFGKEVPDSEKTAKEYASRISKKYEGLGTYLKGIETKEGTLSAAEIDNAIQDLDKSGAGTEALREIHLWASIAKDPNADTQLKEMANKNLYSKLSIVKKEIDVNKEIEERDKALRDATGDQSLRADIVGASKDSKPWSVNIFEATPAEFEKKFNFAENTFSREKNIDYAIIGIASDVIDTPETKGVIAKYRKYDLLTIVEYQSGTNGYAPIKDNGMYKISGKSPPEKIDDEEKAIILSRSNVAYFTKIDTSLCNNPIKSKEAKFWDNGDYAGMPALLPIDEKKGWYIATRQPGAGLKAFDASGRVVNFYLCNVGPNGLMDFFSNNGEKDGKCEMINFDTGMTLRKFSCLKDNEASVLIENARAAVENAASQYQRGARTIYIPNAGNVKVTAPPTAIPSVECEDFMSAKDCNLMFNVCDPVLCPPSRCDFGGKYPVADVVQTGIVGGIMLCLPNAREGIVVPVCLSGIHAGLDNFVMMLKATRDCLQENLKSGRTVGICDQIRSIYLCEFFWKSAIPFIKTGIPDLLSKLSGKSSHGGGEYLVVQDSWDKLDKSINYFTNVYGVNTFKAFQAKSTADVGTEVCKMWVSATYPTNANFFEKLIEPESPTQFYASFSEDLLTDATVPPTSHYKVYYRIYAGKDQGVYYSVYLKGAPSTSYYQTMDTVQVPNSIGYINQGEQADKAIDFTAPQGYKELCVKINAQEKCGFGQVTTSFAVDELKNLYLKEQSTKLVTTEKECIGGSSGVLPPVGLNLQQMAEEYSQPEIYKRGIIRICSTDNPGLQTEPSRWSPVGYCDNENIRCWLDKLSVNQSISDLGILNDTLENAKKQAELIDEEGYWDEDKCSQNHDATLAEGRKAVESIKNIKINENNKNTVDLEIKEKITPALDKLTEFMQKCGYNKYKADVQLMIAEIYDALTRQLYKEIPRATEEGKKIEKREIELKKDILEGKKAGDKISAAESGVGKEVTITSIAADRKSFTAVGEGGETYTFTFDTAKNKWEAQIESIEKQKEERVEMPIGAAAMIIYTPSEKDEEQMSFAELVEYLKLGKITQYTSGTGFTQRKIYSGKIDEKIKEEIMARNNLMEFDEFEPIKQKLEIPLTAQQSSIINKLPVSCEDYTTGVSIWYNLDKFQETSEAGDREIEADRCSSIKLNINSETSGGKTLDKITPKKCGYDYKLKKCAEASAGIKTKNELAEEQAIASFESVVNQLQDCSNTMLTKDEQKFGGCICPFDITQLRELNSPNFEHSNYFAVELTNNKASLKSVSSDFYGGAGGTLVFGKGKDVKPPKQVTMTNIPPCIIHTERKKSTLSSMSSLARTYKAYFFLSARGNEEERVKEDDGIKIKGPLIESWPGGKSMALAKLKSGEVCIITEYTQKNVEGYRNIPVCSGEKKNLNEENSEVPYDSTWGDSVNQDTEQTANVCSPSEETNEDSTATQEDVSSEKTTGSVIAPLTGRSIGEAAVATQGFAKICPLILPSYNDKAFTAATSLEKNSYKKSLYQTINKFSEQYNANFNLVLAIIGVESNWDENLKEGNMYGLMQLTKYPVEDLKTGTCSKVFGPTSIDRYNREQNIKGGVMYLSCLIKKFNKNMPLAIAAYNIGPSEIVKNCKGTIESCSRATRGKAEKYLNKIAAEYVEIVASQEKLNPKIIVIDPGHGGKDPGALNPYKENKNEKVIALEISKKLQNILKSEGYTVLMTRDSDTFKELSERTVFSDAYYADLFVSIHANSFGTTPGEECSSKSGVEVEYFKNTKSSSPKLASTIANNIADVTGLELRGDKKDGAKASNFQVLRETEAPAVLVEPGFICNIKDAGIMADSAKQEKIADAIAEGISNFFG
jgi:N-acetylmuramoyl-L-alanine amidase